MWPRMHRKAQNPQSGGWGSHSGHRPSAGHTPPCMPRAELKGALCGGHRQGTISGRGRTSMQLSPSTGGLLRSLQTLPAPVSSSLFYTLLSAPLSRVLLSISPSSLSALLSILNFLSSYQYRLLVWVCPSVLTSLSISLSRCPFLSVSPRASATLPLPSPSFTGLLSFLPTLSALARFMANHGTRSARLKTSPWASALNQVGPWNDAAGAGSVGHAFHLGRPLGARRGALCRLWTKPRPRAAAGAPDDSGSCSPQTFGGRTHSQWPSGCPSRLSLGLCPRPEPSRPRPRRLD